MTHAMTSALHKGNNILIDPAWLEARQKSKQRAYLVKKDVLSRVGRYVTWLDDSGYVWYRPNLEAYRDYLMQERGLAPATVKAHLATIRGRYKQLLSDNTIRNFFYNMTPSDAAPSDRKAMVDEALSRLDNATKPHQAKVKIITEQDQAEEKHLRLTPDQVHQLIAAPGIKTLKGLRDSALFALLACTGIREAEAVALNVGDLRQYMAGSDVLALHVRDGKGNKSRLVPYGTLDWCLLYVEKWLAAARITEGAVFRGVYKGGKRVRAGRLTTRAIIQIVNDYPVMVNGDMVIVAPHDLRRTYARNLYQAGLGIEEIRQNLGHADIKTTQGYIGVLDASRRKPPPIYVMPISLKELEQVLVL